MKNIISKCTVLLALLLIIIVPSKAQVTLVPPGPVATSNAFMQGQFLEVGVSSCGTYGTQATSAVPAGFHPRFQPGATPNGIGFNADAGANGWNVAGPGTLPDYCGDYFLPGTPVEGFGVQFNGNSFINSDRCTPNNITGQIIATSGAGTPRTTTWQGNVSGMRVNQFTTFPNTARYFVTCITLTNTTTTTMNNVYYVRNVDPDNDVAISNNYTTTNTVVSQITGTTDALVTAVGLNPGCFLGLGSRHPNARVCHGGFSTTAPLSDYYNGIAPHNITVGATATADDAISIAFYFPSLAPGQSITFSFAYVLSAADLNVALAATGVQVLSNGIDISATLTDTICSGDTAHLSLVADPSIIWTWTGTPISSTTGANVDVWPTTTTTYVATGTFVGCGDPIVRRITIVPRVCPPCRIPPNCIQNGDLTGPAGGGNMNSTPALTVPNWFVSHGTPTYSPSNVWMWSYGGRGEGIFTCYNFVAGRTYQVCLRAQYAGTNNTGNMLVRATTGMFQNFGTGVPAPTPIQTIGTTNVTNPAWNTYTYTFTATNNFTQLWIYPFLVLDDGATQYAIRVDNVHVEDMSIPVPTISASLSGPIINGVPVTITATGGGPGTVYQWSNGATGSSITIIPTCYDSVYSVTGIFNNCTTPGIAICGRNTNTVSFKIKARCCSEIKDSVYCKDGQAYMDFWIHNLSTFLVNAYRLHILPSNAVVDWNNAISIAPGNTGGPYTVNLTSLGLTPGSTVCFYVKSIRYGASLCPEDTCNSDRFCIVVPICKEDCCGEWGTISFDDYSDPKAPIARITKCGETIKMRCGEKDGVYFQYFCKEGCEATYKSELYNPSGSVVFSGSSVGSFYYTGGLPLTTSGTYTLKVYVYCGDKLCDSCIIYIRVLCDGIDCCGEWGKTYYGLKGADYVGFDCGSTLSVFCKKDYEFVFDYKCSGECSPTYVYTLTDPSGASISVSSLSSSYINNFSLAGTYTLTVEVYCGEKLCGTCRIFIRTDCIDIDISHDESFGLIPNPAVNKVNLISKNSGIISSYIIQDLNGKALLGADGLNQKEVSVDITNLPNGMYNVIINRKHSYKLTKSN